MKRRNFIRNMLPMAAAPFALSGIPVKAMSRSMLGLNNFSCEEVEDRVMVLVQLAGGNDGLNTFIPIDQYGIYRNLRPNIGIRDTGSGAYTNLDSSLSIQDQVGVHPDFMAVKDLYDNGRINIIQDVCYQDNNKSHFKGTDIWLAGRDGTTATQTNSGWVGRYLDHRFPDYPEIYPNANMPDPLGLQLGSTTLSLGYYRYSGIPVGMALKGDPGDFYNLVAGVGGPLMANFPAGHYGSELQYLTDIERNTGQYASRLLSVYNNGSNSVSYPTGYTGSGTSYSSNYLSEQLSIVARLISGGCKTKFYLVRLNGFDTHDGQVDGGSPHTGGHAVLLNFLSEALRAFQNDLAGLGLEDRVMTVTFSEFGRTAPENGSLGTDHGTTAPMIIMGKGVNPGMTGTNVDLSQIQNNNIVPFQHDYRQIFTTLLQDWMGAGSGSLSAAEMNSFSANKLDLVNNSLPDGNGNYINYVADPICYDGDVTTVFPVEFLDFEATLQSDQSVICEWSTAREMNNELFEIERSLDGMVFESIGEVPGAGNSNSVQSYDFTDTHPLTGTSYYRLRQVDFDGRFTYSEVRKVELTFQPDLALEYTFYPNPVKEVLRVRLEASASSEYPAFMRLNTTTGATVAQKSISISEGTNEFTLPLGNLSPGMYFAEITILNLGRAERLGWAKVVVAP